MCTAVIVGVGAERGWRCALPTARERGLSHADCGQDAVEDRAGGRLCRCGGDRSHARGRRARESIEVRTLAFFGAKHYPALKPARGSEGNLPPFAKGVGEGSGRANQSVVLAAR